MRARLIIVLALVAGLLAGQGARAFCPPPTVQKACCCRCCEKSKQPCGMAAKARCEIPVAQDRTAQPDSKPVPAPQVVAFATIRSISPLDSSSFHITNVEQIPSPPPLALNCIRLI